MNIASETFWTAVVEAGNASAALSAKTQHLLALTVSLEIGESRRVVELHRGRAALLPAPPLRGVTVRITGPAEEWQRLVSGEIPYAHAVNVVHGRLRLQGDIIEAAWATPALWELFRVATRIYKEDA
ncbi:MAG: hypothetical protein ACLQME_17755 [Alphaproteobacteria bacterium]